MSREELDLAAPEPFLAKEKTTAAKEKLLSANESEKTVRTSRIHRSTYVLWLVLFYAALVLASWIIICKLWAEEDIKGWGSVLAERQSVQDVYITKEKWYKAAQVIQSIVAVLTIPLTSTVCSSAVVVYLQHRPNRKNPNFTLRQMAVLADKGWTDIPTLLRLLTGHWSRYFTWFLIWAVALHIVGAIIAPLQSIFLSTKTIKTPTYPMIITSLLDIPDKFTDEMIEGGSGPAIPALRNTLASTSGNDYPSQLWGTSSNCSVRDISHENLALCSSGQGEATWGNVSLLHDPFLAQLPRNYNTGLTQQYLPRFNSTAKYENISELDFPTDCDTVPGALSIRLSDNVTDNTTYSDMWSIHACMPADLRESPWKDTRSRQDFTEKLYLNVSLSTDLQLDINEHGSKELPVSQFYSVTVNTTAGYFELPNYMNGQTAGPLLNNVPCGKSCKEPNPLYDDINVNDDPKSEKRSESYGNATTTEILMHLTNKGPLLTTALALFGENSWLDLLSRYSDQYNKKSNATTLFCLDLAPLGQILVSNNAAIYQGTDISSLNVNQMNRCVQTEQSYTSAAYNSAILAGSWLANFRVPLASADIPGLMGKANDQLSNLFTVAAYLAHMAWIAADNGTPYNLDVTYNIGADSRVISVSRLGIGLISALIALDLLGLLATALYASWFPRWTGSLNTFSVLRIGSFIGEDVPLKVSASDTEVKLFDEMAGWMGDSGTREKVGSIALGGPRGLKSGMRYESYNGKVTKLS